MLEYILSYIRPHQCVTRVPPLLLVFETGLRDFVHVSGGVCIISSHLEDGDSGLAGFESGENAGRSLGIDNLAVRVCEGTLADVFPAGVGCLRAPRQHQL